MFNKDALIKYFSQRFKPAPSSEGEQVPRSMPSGLQPGVAPMGYRRDERPIRGPEQPRSLPEGLRPGVAPMGSGDQYTPVKNPPEVAGGDHHLDRMWNSLTPEEKSGLFGGLMSGKIKVPGQFRSGQVTMPSQSGLERTGYLPTWYRERFSINQPSGTEPLIPRM